MCKNKRGFIDKSEKVLLCGVMVPKWQYIEAQQQLSGLIEETEKTFDIKGLCRRKNEKV